MGCKINKEDVKVAFMELRCLGNINNTYYEGNLFSNIEGLGCRISRWLKSIVKCEV